MIYKICPVMLFLFFIANSKNTTETPKVPTKVKLISTVVKASIDDRVRFVYNSLDANNFQLPELQSFTEALKGYYLLKEKGIIKKNILTLIDFSKSANEKRLWVIDLSTNTILFQSLVSHGKNTGEEFATSFSNLKTSYKSSLGFYATGEIYNGRRGFSLRLDGLEKGINDNARDRGIVVHGADYVSDSFIKDNQRLGRSLGCPAIPVELTGEIIKTIQGQSCLYIYHPSINFEKEIKLIS